MSNPNSLFQEFNQSNKTSNPEEIIEARMTQRADELFNQSISMNEVKEEITEKEESLRKNRREKEFREKRMKQTFKIEYTTSLKDKLTIDREIYEECNKMKVKVNSSLKLGRRLT
jgi:hypothetical protein